MNAQLRPVIRRAAPDDAAALAEFGARCFFDTFATITAPADMSAHLSRTWSAQRQSAEISDASLDTLLACDAHLTLAGFAQVGPGAPGCVPTTAPLELKRLYVDRFWHGNGVAQQLMAAVLDCARRRGANELWLGVWEGNQRAQAFYRKNGFAEVGTQIFMVGSDAQTDRVMLRVLSQGM